MKLTSLASFLPAVLSALSVFATPNPIAGGAGIVVRDPAIAYNSASGKYFLFATDENIKIFTSTSLTGPWERHGSVVPNCSVIQKQGRCNLWAPDVFFYNNRWAVYYSVSWIGLQDSAIGVAVSDTMEEGTWTDLGQVIASTGADVFNAIDPNVIDDNGLKLAFGSYWEGIYQIGLWPDVNNQASDLPGTHLAGGGGRPAEGGFVYKPQSQPYFYLFFSEGTTLSDSKPAPGAEYKVLVGRGHSGQGPFYDQNGSILTNANAGTLVLGSHDNVYAPGGQSVIRDPVSGRDVMVYHYIPNDKYPTNSVLGINYLDFSSGWPVVV